MSLKLGITGGIGSGKSTVCKIFNVLGIPVFSADDEARIIMDSDPGVIGSVNSIAGMDMYENGVLDRKQLARLIFNDRSLLEQINTLIHPVVLESFKEWVSIQKTGYVILESAILFESGASQYLDRVATVTAPVEERISRVIKRNKFTREQVLERINNQEDDAVKVKKSDFVISNAENDMVIPAVIEIHEYLLELIKKGN